MMEAEGRILCIESTSHSLYCIDEAELPNLIPKINHGS